MTTPWILGRVRDLTKAHDLNCSKQYFLQIHSAVVLLIVESHHFALSLLIYACISSEKCLTPLCIVDKKSFVRLADLLNIRVITVKLRSHPLEVWLPHVYNSAPSLFIRSMVQHK